MNPASSFRRHKGKGLSGSGANHPFRLEKKGPMEKKHLSKITAVATIFLSLSAHAEEKSKFALPLSASAGIGTMASGGMNVKSRTMNALSIEALPSYRMGKWLIGPHLDYRVQGQVSSLSDAGGTNLKGSGWLIGLGVRHDFDDKFFVQGAIDFLGAYDLSKDTAAGEDDNLKAPIGLRAKTGYAFLERIPNLTFDADLQLLQYKTIHIGGADRDETFNQLMASVGLTYQFGFGKAKAAPVEGKAETPVVAKSTEALEKIEGVEKVGSSLRLNMSGANFNSGSADLSPEAKSQFADAARAIAQSNASVRVEGHTDSSGRLAQNNKLSQARAESVKAFLIEHGVSAERVSAQGFGPSKPIADNASVEGRAKNRRVEIFMDEAKN